ncbi:MAG: transglutaminase-like domain-containing protein [Nanoarchaeota archaeon]
MVRALEWDSGIEGIALSQTSHIPSRDRYGRAKALYHWMRSNIGYDTNRYEMILAGQYYGSYRNSVETLQDRLGVCGEQAMLYIMLARCSGLDARYARNNQRPGHAIARVHCDHRHIDVDTTKDGPTGFDRDDTYFDFFEVPESELDELVNRHREQESVQRQDHVMQQERPYDSPDRQDYWHGPRFHRPRFIRPDVTCRDFRNFLIAACFILPWVWSMSHEIRVQSSLARPVLVSDSAKRYMEASRSLALRGAGGGSQSFELSKRRFDFDSDGVLDRYEAYAMYRSLVEEDRE